MSYQDACRTAAIDQGLGAFLEHRNWEVEQTGGFTMVAVQQVGDGTVWCVTQDGDESAPYLAVHTTVEAWQEGLDVEPLAVAYLTLADALAL